MQAASVCPGTSCDGPAELPRFFINTDFFVGTAPNFQPNFPGYVTKTVCASGCNYSNLQNAFNNVHIDGGDVNGEVILLASGQTFSGNFNFPAYTMAPGKWVVVKTNTADSNLPADGIRVTPSYSPVLAKIFMPNAGPVIQMAPGSNHVWFMGLEIGTAPGVTLGYTGIAIGTSLETSVSQLAHDIVIDRCYVHANPTGSFQRGVNVGGVNIAVVNSYFENWAGPQTEAQAISTWFSPGPLKIVNNFLEAGAENILFGGADTRIANVVASDIEIRFNHLDKKVSWYDPFSPTRRLVKNGLELKNAQRVLIEGNIIEHAWADGQRGNVIILTPRNQNGTNPWSTVADVTIRFNLLRNSAYGFAVAGEDQNPSQPSQRISFHDNILDGINGVAWHSQYGTSTGDVFFITNGGSLGPPGLPPRDIFINHNTGFSDGRTINFGDNLSNRIPGFTFTNNIVSHNQYGIWGSGTASGNIGLAAYLTSPIVTGNVLAVPTQGAPPYPAGNFLPATWPAVQFVNFNGGNGGDYHLLPSSPYKGIATDAAARLAAQPNALSTDLGADVDAVILYTCMAITGNPGSSCSALPPSAPTPSVGNPPPPANPPATGVNALPTPIVRPNPWRADRHGGTSMIFEQLPVGGEIKLFTASGRLMRTLSTNSGTVTWDLKNSSGDKIASGIYVYLVTDSEGQTTRGKFAVIK